MLLVLFLELRALLWPLVFYLQLLDTSNHLATIATIEIVNMCYLQVVHYLSNQPLTVKVACHKLCSVLMGPRFLYG